MATLVSVQTPLEVPVGYELAPFDEEFLHLVGPLYRRQEENGGSVIALRACRQHVNRYGIVHGGLLASLADVAVGVNIGDDALKQSFPVTAHLELDYISHAVPGDWIEAKVKMNKNGRNLSFGSCEISVDERLVARASAIYFARR